MTPKEQILIDIYNKNRAQLYAHAQKFLKGTTDVDDVLNAALYASLKCAEKIKYPNAFLHHCVFQAAYPLILKERSKARTLTMYSILNYTACPNDYDYSTNVEESLSDELLKILHSLEPYEQTIVKHRVFDNMLFKQIGDIIGYSERHTGHMYRNAVNYMWEQLA